MKNKKLYLKKSLISKEALLLWSIAFLSIIFSLYPVLKEGINSDITVYYRVQVLFNFGIVIIVYLFFINIYLKYINNNTLVRYVKVSNYKKKIELDIIIFSIIFVIMFNIMIAMITVKFLKISLDDIVYLVFLILFQILAFILIGLVYLAIYFKTFKQRSSLIIVFLLYLFFYMSNTEVSNFFILPINITIEGIIMMLKKIMSIYCILALYLIITIDKGVDIYA